MTLEEAMEATVTREEARREIEENHSCDGGWLAFVEEHGWHDTYPGSVVLGWIGY